MTQRDWRKVIIISLFTGAVRVSTRQLQPGAIKINRAAADGDDAIAVGSRSVSITWDLLCADVHAHSCVGMRQIAYRVRLRGAHDGTLLLDSGRRNTSRSQHDAVFHLLRSAQRYSLEVTAWASPTRPPLTTIISMRTALLDVTDWRDALWLGGFTQLRGNFALAQPPSAISSALAHASGVGCFTMSVNGLAADATANNASYMDPGWANVPSVRMLYRQYDVSSLLRSGTNVIGARLGQCKYGYQGSFCAGAHGSLATCRAFRMLLIVTYEDGTSQTIATQPGTPADTGTGGARWLGTTDLNPIRYTHLYHGEIVDSRIGDPHWDTVGSTPTTGPGMWAPAVQYEHASALASQMTLLVAPPIAVTAEIPPSSIRPLGTTAFVFDFGNNMAGFTRMTSASALPAGTTITLKYGEVLKNGSVYQPWGKGPGINQANQTDQYTFRGSTAGETYTPSFTYHGFRYVQVEGLPTGVVPGKSFLTALFVRTAVPRSGHIRFGHHHHHSSHGDAASPYPYAVLNEIQAAIVQTQASNVHSHPTDCPQREKRGWTGDAQVTSGEASLNFDTASMYSAWLTSMQDSADVSCALAPQTPTLPQPNCFLCCNPSKPSFGCDFHGLPPGGAHGGFEETRGSVADVVPFTHVGGWPGDPSWGVAGATIPWEVMMASGDVSIAADFYQLAKGEVDFLTRQGNPQLAHLVTFGYYGDWLSLEKSPPIPKPQVVGWSHLLGISRVLEMARALGKKNDEATYAILLANLTSAYRATYMAEDGSFGTWQTANVLSLYLNLTTAGAGTAATTAALVDSLGKHGNRTLSGLVGVSYLFQALTRAGKHQLALAIASATEEPSWGYMVRKGPGTIWETWDGTTNSHNHPMFCASIGKYLYALGGLQPDEWVDQAVPELCPAGGDAATAAALGSASVTIASRRGAGRISLAWSYDGAGRSFFHVNASVPPGFASARLFAPPLTSGGSFTLKEHHSGLTHHHGRSVGTSSEDGEALLRHMGVLQLTAGTGDEGWSELLIQPGHYAFSLEPTAVR